MHNYKYWIALEQAKGMGPAHLQEIHDRLGKAGLSLVDLFDLKPEELKAEFPELAKIAEAFPEARALLPRVEEDYLDALDFGASIVPFYSQQYPQRLRLVLGNAIPPFLYVLGKQELLGTKGIAILGDRDVSDRGEMIAYKSAQEVCRHGMSVISGMAAGADMIAHRAALEHGGTTIAVVPYGIRHFRVPGLLEEVYDPERFLVVSPFYPAREATKFNAFIRNKIACALSCAVYIVESPAEGGIFEAGKSARNLNVPLYTTQYSEYPVSAAGNKKMIDELGAQPVRGRMEGDLLVPNIDRIIAHGKFD